MSTLQEARDRASKVRPHPRQVLWNQMEFYAFVHFGLYTFGIDVENQKQVDLGMFNPAQLDADQWVSAFKAAGMTGLILTCKHHEGFCLWPSRYTEFSVRNTPWRGGRGDVVREVSDACRRQGLKFGVYLSPWDMTEKTYGTPEYDIYFKNQLRELLTNYGEVFCVWFDGANRSKTGVQNYDWDGYYRLIRELQPNAVICICGPDVRWIGNEAGISREEEWSVVPEEIMKTERNPGYWRNIDSIPNSTWKDLGSAEFIRNYPRLIWYPAEVDVSIRPGWGYSQADDDQVKSLNELMYIYEKAVGGNANLLLNVPPDPRGLLMNQDVNRLAELGSEIHKMFERDQTPGCRIVDESNRPVETLLDSSRESFYAGGRTPVLTVTFPEKREFNLIRLKETIENGQQIEKFSIEIPDDDGWQSVFEGTTIGYQKFCCFRKCVSDRLRIRVIQSRGSVSLTQIGIYDDEERAL